MPTVLLPQRRWCKDSKSSEVQRPKELRDVAALAGQYGALIDGEPPVTRGSVVGPLTPAAASTSFPPRRRFSTGHWTREIATDRPRRLSSYRTQELDEE